MRDIYQFPNICLGEFLAVIHEMYCEMDRLCDPEATHERRCLSLELRHLISDNQMYVDVGED